jgi:predicted AAA+ superfamily ATPase
MSVTPLIDESDKVKDLTERFFYTRFDPHREPYCPVDGIREGDPLVLNREHLQNILLDPFHDRTLVTTPPASGKTSMIQLIKKRLEKEGKKVLLINAVGVPSMMKDEEFRKWINNYTLEESKVATLREALKLFDFILVDDAQKLYKFKQVIDDLIKSPNPFHLIMFASVSPLGSSNSTPVVPRRIYWEDFRLSNEETDEFCARVLQHPYVKEKFPWTKEILTHLKVDVEGHIGLLRLFLDRLFKEFSGFKSPPSFNEVYRFYMGSIFESSIAQRFFSFSMSNFNASMIEKLERILLDGKIEAPPPSEDNQVKEDQRIIALRNLILSFLF